MRRTASKRLTDVASAALPALPAPLALSQRPLDSERERGGCSAERPTVSQGPEPKYLRLATSQLKHEPTIGCAQFGTLLSLSCLPFRCSRVWHEHERGPAVGRFCADRCAAHTDPVRSVHSGNTA